MNILKPGDREKLQAFCCGNSILDNYIKNEIFETADAQGLHFIFEDEKTGDVICFVSLAASGIIYRVDAYSHVLPAIKIDVIAVDKRYQKLHIDEYSEKSSNPDDHFYLSDSIMSDIIVHCREINERYALVNYIILYADKDAERFYRRNYFEDYTEFMEKENNMEIRKNIPMFAEL